MFTLPGKPDALGDFLGGTAQSFAGHYLQDQAKQKKLQKTQQAFANLNAETSPLDMLQMFQQADLTPQEQQVFLSQHFRERERGEQRAYEAGERERKKGTALEVLKDLQENATPFETLQAFREAELSPQEQNSFVNLLKAKNPKSAMTAYQDESLKVRKLQNELRGKELTHTKSKARRELQEKVVTLTKDVAKQNELSSDDKNILDQYISSRLIQDDKADYAEAVQEGLNAIQMKNSMLEAVEVPTMPGWLSQTSKEEGLAQLEEFLGEVAGTGIRSYSDLKTLAKRGGWKDRDIDPILKRVLEPNRTKEAKSEEPKKDDARQLIRTSYDEQLAATLIKEEVGDNEEAFEKLFNERYRYAK